jgi:hypothetical protein
MWLVMSLLAQVTCVTHAHLHEDHEMVMALTKYEAHKKAFYQ